jgi:hypothetical protein
MMIRPYWSDDLAIWVFTDASVDLEREPFVSGAETILDELVRGVPDARDGVLLLSSASPFPGFQRSLTLAREEYGGRWYGLDGSSFEGWLCSALFRYFSEAPAKLYVRITPSLPGNATP